MISADPGADIGWDLGEIDEFVVGIVRVPLRCAIGDVVEQQAAPAVHLEIHVAFVRLWANEELDA